jgi:RHS repeat-associated protein
MFSADPYANRFLYTGREFLKEANLYDYRNRVYSAELGRFLQTDPIRFEAGDGNLYRYVNNNSSAWFDPFGLFDWGYEGPNHEPPYRGPSKGNCWRYACNDPAKPGEEHNQIPPGWDPFNPGNNCSKLMSAARSAGAKDPDSSGCCPKGMNKIHLMLSTGKNLPTSNGEDFHYYRQDSKTGNWSHKPGKTGVRDTGPDGKPIKDPSKDKNPIYNHDCGQLCVPDGFDTDSI